MPCKSAMLDQVLGSRSSSAQASRSCQEVRPRSGSALIQLCVPGPRAQCRQSPGAFRTRYRTQSATRQLLPGRSSVAGSSAAAIPVQQVVSLWSSTTDHRTFRTSPQKTPARFALHMTTQLVSLYVSSRRDCALSIGVPAHAVVALRACTICDQDHATGRS